MVNGAYVSTKYNDKCFAKIRREKKKKETFKQNQPRKKNLVQFECCVYGI